MTNNKTLIAIAIILGLTLIACFGAQVKLVWDPNDPSEQVAGYVVYELKGTNYTRVAVVTTNEAVLTVEPGLHIYAVKATNWWGESPFSDTARTPPASTSPRGQRVEKLP